MINLTGCTLPSATLDSAVTLGTHGAKTFLMRDGKETVQCVFYENVRKKHSHSNDVPGFIRGLCQFAPITEHWNFRNTEIIGNTKTST